VCVCEGVYGWVGVRVRFRVNEFLFRIVERVGDGPARHVICVCVCVCVCTCECFCVRVRVSAFEYVYVWVWVWVWVWVNVCAYEFASHRYLFRNDELVDDGPAWPCRLRNVCVWMGG